MLALPTYTFIKNESYEVLKERVFAIEEDPLNKMQSMIQMSIGDILIYLKSNNELPNYRDSFYSIREETVVRIQGVDCRIDNRIKKLC